MSHALCEIWARDGSTLIGRTNYSGSSDTIAPGIADTIDEAWHSGGWDRLGCDHEPTVAWAYSWYALGNHWPVKVCERCRVVIEPLGPYEPDWGYAPIGMTPERRQEWYGAVAWWKAFRAAGWPKDGPPPGVPDMDARA